MKKSLSSLNSVRWALAIAVATAFCSAAQAGPQVFQDSMPRAISHLSATGRLDAKTPLNLSVGLPLRNESALDSLLGQLYDPSSPNYRHYLTQQQFIDQFAPSASDYQTVANFFGTNGFTVVQHSSRMVLDVSGSAADVERVFHVTMRTYKHPTENRNFFGPDTFPSLNVGVPILHISGMDNYALKKPKFVKEAAVKRSASGASQSKTRPRAVNGSGPSGAYMGSDFRAAYIPGVSLTGAGQTVGLLEFDGYFSSDISDYENLAGVSVPETIVPVDGGVSTPGAGDDEVSLDIEVAMSIAPGLTQIVVYESGGSSWEDLLDAMANDTVNSPKQFSCSWGDSSPDVPNLTAENIFKQMDAQGQTFYDAAGDGDAFVGGIPFPAESTNIVEVGGTTVTTTGPGGPWMYETVWNWGGDLASSGSDDSSSGGSGGISLNYSIPPWQQGINMTANQGSTNMRNVPDVSMTADNVYVSAGQSQDDGTFGGTSCAAPAWAAFTALANEQAAVNGKPSVGFPDPVLYGAGKSTSYPSDFNDITAGNNEWAFSINQFSAIPGYDLCTGWGTPAGDNLIDLLAGVADSMGVAPGKGFVAFGSTNGAFSATTLTFSLTNSSTSSLNWSLVNTSSWLTASSSGGALAAHATAKVTVSLNPAADSLPAGTYVGGVLFSNQTSHAVRTREFVLVDDQNLVQNGDFGDVPYGLPEWEQTGGIGMYNEVPFPSFNYTFTDDGFTTGYNPYPADSYFCVFGEAGGIGYISEDIATVPGQTYELSFELLDATNGVEEQFLVNWNPNSNTTNTVYYLENPDSGFDWSNVVLYVTATSAITTLQFGGRNDPDLWGLDAVTLMPVGSVSAAAINANISRTSPSTVVLTWNSVSGQAYQVQYSASLHPPNWTNLSTNTASGSTMSVTIAVGSNPQGYYRIVVP